ncbi:ADP-heptose:LPS heptosyltransferase [hydrothermal vent metagenome]|uniref:ADP-heptose:LPS heptosyltransferase n=1 Tax=hydrothermal vent metagenome TaxID=652676 RepID=A0A3B0QYD6_9ZZZZ
MQKPPKHILVIRLSAMGDVAMIVPVLRALTQQYPGIKITVLTRKFFTPFFRDLENVQVFHADVKGKHKGVLGLYKLSRELKTLRIDAIADLHNVLRSNILKFFFSGTKHIQIDKGRAEKKALTSGKQFRQLKSTHQRYAEVFEQLGFKINLLNPVFPKPYPLSDKILDSITRDNKKRIGIAPFAAFKGKAYPLELMEQVIKELSKTYSVLLFGGGQKEIETLHNFEAEFENVHSVAGKLSLDEELDVISNLDVMISMDSGNAHIAAMLGIEVITLWGVTHPFAGFYPFNQNKENALLAHRNLFPQIPTSIYGNTFPKGYQDAIRSITPQDIITKVEYIIQKSLT